MINETDGAFIGYAVDLVEAIFAHMNTEHKKDFTYKFYRVTSGGQGNPIEGTKKWSGLIGELREHVSYISRTFLIVRICWPIV